MDHVAIDLGGRESQICVRASDGEVLDERRVSTSSLTTWIAERSRCHLVMETCAESFKLADVALAHGHVVRVVPSTLVRALGVGARRTKNDQRDARALSEASCRMDLPSVHIPSAVARRRKTLCGTRDALVAARTQLVNCVRGWMRQHASSVRRGYTATFSRRVREHFGAELPAEIERLLAAIEALSAQVAAADAAVEKEAKQDPVCKRLMTVPGVGPVTAVRFCAALDRVDRFANAHAVQSYLGLVPGESSSGDKVRRLGITKAGSRMTRVALVQAAWSARRCRRNDAMVRWSVEVERRRGKHVAALALARKIAGILYALWRRGTIYNPFDGAAAA